MESENQVAQILGDISILREQIRYSQDGKPPEIVLVYLLANYNLIEFYLSQSYEKLNEAQRRELYNNHRELDTSAVRDEFRSTAEQALRDAKNYWIAVMPDTPDDDSLNMLWRGLAFAQYAPISLIGMTLLMHPIQDYLPLKKENNIP